MLKGGFVHMINADCQCCWRQETLDKELRQGSGQPTTVFLALDYKLSWPEARKSSDLLTACPGQRSERLTIFMGTGSYSAFLLLSFFSFNTGEQNIYGCNFPEALYELMLHWPRKVCLILQSRFPGREALRHFNGRTTGLTRSHT